MSRETAPVPTCQCGSGDSDARLGGSCSSIHHPPVHPVTPCTELSQSCGLWHTITMNKARLALWNIELVLIQPPLHDSVFPPAFSGTTSMMCSVLLWSCPGPLLRGGLAQMRVCLQFLPVFISSCSFYCSHFCSTCQQFSTFTFLLLLTALTILHVEHQHFYYHHSLQWYMHENLASVPPSPETFLETSSQCLMKSGKKPPLENRTPRIHWAAYPLSFHKNILRMRLLSSCTRCSSSATVQFSLGLNVPTL